MFKVAQFNEPAQEHNETLRINNFSGINLSNTPTQIAINESPDMLNMLLDDEGALDSRTGFGKLFATSLGTGQVNGLYKFEKIDGTVKYLLHHGTSLYTFLLDGTAPTSIYASMANALSNFFTFNNKCYIMDGTNYLSYDGTTVIDVTANGNYFVPTLTLGRAPTGGGTPNEQFNLLGAAFKDSFSSPGAATAYTLSLTGLDVTLVTATVDGVAKVEITDFTVNRTTGVVTFSAAPATGTNNVVITAYKTVAGNKDKIRNCKSFVVFGGNNDTRVFWARNASFPNQMFRSGLFDPTYAPELGFVKVGSDAGIIQGFAKQFSTCVILKEPTPNDTTQYSMSYLDTGGTITFPIIQLNDDIGLTAPRTVELLNNLPTYLSQKGVFQTVGSNVRDERNVMHISAKVDNSYNNQIQALLAETNLQNAITVDYDKKYILVVNGRAYVYDYRKSTPDNQVWYVWDNINASCFLEIGGYLYFGSDSAGLVYKFKKSNELYANTDDGTAINAYWKSRIESLGFAFRYKNLRNVYLSIKPALSTAADLYYIDDQGTTTLQDTISMTQYSYVFYDYGHFGYVTTNFPQVLPSKFNVKKILYFQVMVKNNTDNQSLGILELTFEYNVHRLVR